MTELTQTTLHDGGSKRQWGRPSFSNYWKHLSLRVVQHVISVKACCMITLTNLVWWWRLNPERLGTNGMRGKVHTSEYWSWSHEAGPAKLGHPCNNCLHKTKQWQSHLFHKGGYQLGLSTHDFPNQLLVHLCKGARVIVREAAPWTLIEKR